LRCETTVEGIHDPDLAGGNYLVLRPQVSTGFDQPILGGSTPTQSAFKDFAAMFFA
jgi:hypothetical protein